MTESTLITEANTEPDDFSDLLNATNSVLDFWDNPMDDEDWNVPLEENYE